LEDIVVVALGAAGLDVEGVPKAASVGGGVAWFPMADAGSASVRNWADVGPDVADDDVVFNVESDVIAELEEG
jgi:hypothetical protein